MYSDMSTRMSACASANRNLARARASSVFPTPVGPEKMNEPIGRLGSLSPARDRRMARETALMASSWPTTDPWISSSIRISLDASASCSRVTGMPVQRETMTAMASSSISGRLDHHRLEPPLQRPVLLDVLPVFVQGRGADALQLAPRQRGLEHVGRVDGAFGGAGAHQGVELVDEQDDLLVLGDLVHDRLEP